MMDISFRLSVMVLIVFLHSINGISRTMADRRDVDVKETQYNDKGPQIDRESTIFSQQAKQNSRTQHLSIETEPQEVVNWKERTENSNEIKWMDMQKMQLRSDRRLKSSSIVTRRPAGHEIDTMSAEVSQIKSETLGDKTGHLSHATRLRGSRPGIAVRDHRSVKGIAGRHRHADDLHVQKDNTKEAYKHRVLMSSSARHLRRFERRTIQTGDKLGTSEYEVAMPIDARENPPDLPKGLLGEPKGPLADNRNLCAGIKWCNCLSETVVYCDGGGPELTYIPKVPATIQKFYFYDNFLPYMDNLTFSNLTSLNLTYLNIGNNSLSRCESGVFSGLHNLDTLVIEDEVLGAEEFIKCLSGLNKTNVIMLSFPEVILSRLPENVFSGLIHSKVQWIEMYGTQFKMFEQQMFSGMSALRHIQLNNCGITDTKLSKGEFLEELYLPHNRLITFPKFCVDGKPVYPTIKQILLDHNYISSIVSSDIQCLNNLQNLSFFGNPISFIRNNTFSHLSNLKWLEITLTSNQITNVEPLAFNISSLIHLSFGGHNERIEWAGISRHLFAYCPNLLELDLSSNSLRLLTEEDFQQLLSPLKNLRQLSIAGTGITFLPLVISTDLLKLEGLYAAVNSIIGWPDYFFSPLTYLRSLDLYANDITVVNKTSFSLSQIQGMKMAMDFNPFVCSCDLLWFMHLLESHRREGIFDGYPLGYLCSAPTKFQHMRLDKVPLSDRYCALTAPIEVSLISVTSVILASVLIGSLIYRYRWYIKYAAYMFHFQQRRRQRLQDGGNDAHYTFDLYVSCSDDDLDLLLDEVIPHLEEDFHLRLFISHRDGIGFKMDDIVKNMDDSRQVVLFISNSYAQDYYCEFEASLAFERYLHEKTNSMIVILLQDVDALCLNRILYRIVKTGEYIYWRNDPHDKHLCWLKLESAITNRDDIRP